MPRPTRPTFTSYLPTSMEDSFTNTSDTGSLNLSLQSHDGVISEPTYLPGELMVNHCSQVIRYIPYSQQSSGQLGELYVTNFRVTFQPYEQLPGQAAMINHQRNKLYREDDIVLANIFSVYHVSKGRRKKLVPGPVVSKSVKAIEIHCKDFRTHNFCLKKSPKDTANQVINALVHHAFPQKQSLLFAFEYQGDGSPNGDSVTKYNSKWDWGALLQRLQAMPKFTVTDVNQEYHLAASLPQHFVVPSSLTNQIIRSTATQFVENRCPLWCYSHSNGAALIRMSKLIPDTLTPEAETMMLEAIKKSHPKKRSPYIRSVADILPTPRDILVSFEKLRELLMPVSVKELELSDANWFSLVDDTNWLQHVSSCLKEALRASDAMNLKGLSVLVTEEAGGRDLSPLLTCLVQLLLDPYTRTMAGFQQLVEREWVALGHRFLDRMVLEYNTESADPCPVFLLFIDCVWQLLQQFPSAFEFSEMYLTTLWDSTCIGLFENFIFNCARERMNHVSHNNRKVYADNAVTDHSKLMSVWDWSKQFSKEDMALFNNPLYKTRTELDLKVNKLAQGKRKASSLRKSAEAKYPYKLSETFRYEPEIKTNVLRPVVCPQLVRFWSHCYLRWLTPVQILSGGSPSEYLQQCVLVEEIMHLRCKINSLLTTSSAARPKSNLIFDGAREKGPPKRQWSETVSSSFPFSPMRTSTRFSLFETTVSHYLEKSLVNFPEDDTISMDSLECSLDDSINFSVASYASTPKKGPMLINPYELDTSVPTIDVEEVPVNHTSGGLS